MHWSQGGENAVKVTMTCNQIPSKIALDKPKTRIQMQFRELKQQLNPGNEMRASSPKQNGQPKNLSEREKYVKLSMTYLLCIHLAQWSRSNEQLSVQVSSFCVRVHVNIYLYTLRSRRFVYRVISLPFSH